MATINLPPDYKEFLKLLNDHQVEYLVIGDYAVGYHGYPRATVDLDIWIAIDLDNASKIVTVLKEFGFNPPELSEDIFLEQWQIIRMGIPPLRIEIATTISGVDFDEYYKEKVTDMLDDIEVNLINLEKVKINKKASGRHQDLADLEHLT